MSVASCGFSWLLGVALTLGFASGAHAMMRCSLVTTSGVSFGAYDGYDVKPLESTGSIAFQCFDVGSSDMLSLQLSSGNSDNYFPRTLRGRRHRLEYNLFLDAGRSLVWGDGNGGTSAYTVHPPEGATVSVPIFGRIPARQNIAPGSYADVIVLTVLY